MKERKYTIEELARHMLEKTEDYDLVYSVLFYDDAKRLLKELLTYNETEVGCIELEAPCYSGYEREFYIVISDDYRVSVEKAWHDNNGRYGASYYVIGDGHVFIDADANSSIITNAEDCKFTQIEVVDSPKYDFSDECVTADNIPKHSNGEMSLRDKVELILNILDDVK